MLVREFLNHVNCCEVTFIKARARKDANTPFFHSEYQTTPIFSSKDVWLQESVIMDYIILNDKQAPIDWLSGVEWRVRFDRGHLLSLLVISPSDFSILFPNEEQRESMIAYIDKQIFERRCIKS